MKPRRHAGAGLMVALVMLVIMSLGAISLVRAVSTGRMVAANLALRQAAVLAADTATEAAINWLKSLVTTADLYADQPDKGYYASVPDGLDITGLGANGSSIAIDWESDGCKGSTASTCVKPAPALDADAAGNVMRYTIHRLCRSAGSPQSGANSCLMVSSSAASSGKRGQISYGASSRFTMSAGVYYRITVRTRGPRNTVVFTQTLVHF